MKTTKILALLAAVPLCVMAKVGDGPFEHVVCEAVSLDGAWEMAYRPYAWETSVAPVFEGVSVANAVPGYWEDLVPAFRAAGMTDEFRVHPWHVEQRLPITGSASDLTLPDPYGCFLYRRSVVLPRGGAAALAFEGVRNQVHVWINGAFVAFRAGFSTPFELAVPDGVLRAGTNEIVLAVSNNPNPGYCDFVSGLTTRAVFRGTGGVNGHLELRYPKNDLADVYVTTAADLKTFTVHVSGRTPFAYAIRDGGRVLAEGRATGSFTLPTDGLAFWSPESPRRYELVLTTPEGTYAQKFGLRRLVAHGEKLRLNGEPVYLRGVTEHCYFPQTIHLPRDLDYYRMITRRRKALGFNFVRFHTFVPPVEYLEATDELGMLVHAETPNFVSEPEFAAIVAFARRHPSVVIYCTGNETRIDRIAEAYLRDVAALVHDGTDALFSPMSALRGVEYYLMPGVDEIAPEPFAHNPGRMRRLAAFGDLWTSYQLGLTSYFSVNKGTSEDLDRWGDAYCGKPRLSHEICIDSSYADLGLEALYPTNSPILKTDLFAGVRRQLAEKGLLDRADVYFRNSCEWMRRVRKFTFEKLRAADRVAGYDFLGDINTHWHTFGYSVGLMDEFYRLKPGETVENVRRYNDAAVLLADFGSDFNVRCGETRRVAFSLSNYAAPAPDATLTVELVAAADGRVVASRTLSVGDVANGTLTRLGDVALEMPRTDDPAAYLLRARFAGGAVRVENEWELMSFPAVEAKTPAGVRVVETATEDDLARWMEKGERVVLLGSGPFPAVSNMSFRIGMAGRCTAHLATVVKKGHPALRGLPHAGFCGWPFRRLVEGAAPVQIESGAPFDPIIDVASSVKCVIRQSVLFEYRVGDGRLLVCTFNFANDDPASAWVRQRLLDYAASDDFRPASCLTTAELRALARTPFIDSGRDTNRARNVNDPASDVRADAFAQP
jgi:hypothetical protein